MSIAVINIITIFAISIIIFMLIKKMDIKITLFAIGIMLMYIALIAGENIDFKGFEPTGFKLLDPLDVIGRQFKSTLSTSGFIILILGGYSAYMSKIGANDVTVSVLTKPIGRIKSVYILVPIIFLLGNLLSLVVPSASNLAIILLATLYPVLRAAGMSTLTAAAVIATTATVMPTPLGSDNVAIAQELAGHLQFEGLDVTTYVMKYHAPISVPTLGFMAAVHYFWQKFMDKKDAVISNEDLNSKGFKKIEGGVIFRIVYALLPLLPILLLILTYILDASFTLSVEVVSLICFILAILCEIIRYKGKMNKEVLESTESFFKGMANGMSIVVLLVAASVFVVGLKSIGLISNLQDIMMNTSGSGLGIILPTLLVGVTALIVLLSGSGTALFFAMVPLMVPLAAAAGINPVAISVPMGLAGNLLRAVSPVSAVILIVAGSVKRPPMEIVKRTAVPMIAGTVFMLILSIIIFAAV